MGLFLNPDLEQRIAAEVRSGLYSSADEVVRKGLDLLEEQEAGAPVSTTAIQRPIWEVIAEIGSGIPEEEWIDVPPDFAKNLEHYLYGAPKDSE